jgi:eukaryotic-like serine/threonine-protein kinase
MAWRRLGVTYNNVFDPARAIPALRRAYALRNQMPPLEAAHVTAFYYWAVDDNEVRAAQAYDQLLATWPEEQVALNNLAFLHSNAFRSRQAANLYRQVRVARPQAGLYIDNLVQTLVKLDEFQEADSLLDVRLAFDTGSHRRVIQLKARITAERGDYDRAYAIVDSVAKIAPAFKSNNFDLFLRQGRLREATPLLGPWILGVIEAVIRGNQVAGQRMLDKPLAAMAWDSLPPNDPRPYGNVARFLVLTGNIAGAEDVLARQARKITPDVLRKDGNREYAMATIALARGDARTALTSFREARRILRCNSCTAFDEGRAFEKLNEPDSAIVQYERFVNSHNTDPENREYFLAAALRRLGEMYESKGDRKKAVEYYGRFVDLWKNADAELQPLVADIRKQMTQLAGEPPRP